MVNWTGWEGELTIYLKLFGFETMRINVLTF